MTQPRPSLIPEPISATARPPLARGADVAGLGTRLDRPVVMVGLMGSGKTAVGRRLATQLGWRFLDADEEIERAARCSISEIFAQFGEAYFRDGERRVIARLLNPTDTDHRKVIATGGGAFCNAETRALILAQAVAIWLDAEVETLVARTARRNTRPLLQEGDPRATLSRLAAERRPHYAAAPLRVQSGDGPLSKSTYAALSALADWQAGQPSAPVARL